jgi:hypothetical protein
MRKIAENSRLKGASWSKFEEFADEFAAIRAAQVRRKIAPSTCRAAPLLRSLFDIV